MAPILIVDDEFGIVNTIQDLLQDEGYRTVTAHNGRQAMDQLVLERPLMILLDDMMPVMDGTTLVLAMREIAGIKDIPVVMMSANRPKPWHRQHCTAFLAKPFNLMELLAVIYRVAGPPPSRE